MGQRRTDGPGGDGRGGGTPGGEAAGNVSGRGLWAQPELPGLRGRAAAVPEQDEKRPDAPERTQPAGGQRLHGRPLQGHGCLKGSPTAALWKPEELTFEKGIRQTACKKLSIYTPIKKKKIIIRGIDIVYL